MTARPTLAFSKPDFAAEANHRIANSLALVASLIRMQASSIASGPRTMNGDDMRMVLDELGSRVETIARLHHGLANGPSDAMVDLGDYLQEISGPIVSALSAVGQIRLRFSCKKDCLVPPEQALSLRLIVAELVTNAVKYAHPAGVAGEINVGCGQDGGGTITIEVSDDGVGFPEDFDPMKDGNLGLRLVRSLASQLPARISFTHDALGTSFALQMPKAVSA